MKRITILCAALALCASMATAQIAATSAKSYAHPTHRSRRYVITDFGAVGDGKTLNTKAIQAAIDKCASTKKGGVLVIPKGTFLSGAIFLKQGVNLLLEKDGVLKGSRDPDDYPQRLALAEYRRGLSPADRKLLDRRDPEAIAKARGALCR